MAETEILTSKFVKFDERLGTGYMIDILRCEVAPKHVAEISVYEAVKFKDGTIEVQDNSGTGQHWTADRANGEVYLRGNVKWDGCSNWSFYPEDHCMIHLCGPEDADELAWLIKQCYQIAKDELNFTEF